MPWRLLPPGKNEDAAVRGHKRTPAQGGVEAVYELLLHLDKRLEVLRRRHPALEREHAGEIHRVRERTRIFQIVVRETGGDACVPPPDCAQRVLDVVTAEGDEVDVS